MAAGGRTYFGGQGSRRKTAVRGRGIRLSGILVTGRNGQVGFELILGLAGRGRVIAVGRDEMDLSNPDSIRRTVRDACPDLIVNAAAYTAVDQAESEPGLAMAVNGIAPGILAEEAKRLGAALIHYSTDYVFDGVKAAPYTEDDEPRPINTYGKTKLAGERAIQAVDGPHLILRTSWIYGTRGKNFLLTILRLAREREELSIVDDQVGAPTWSRAVAVATRDILDRLGYGQTGFLDACTKQRGIYNLSAAGQTSWYGFAAAILDQAANVLPGRSEFTLARVPVLKPIQTEQYPLPASRPRYSVLANAKLRRAFSVALPDWKISLAECMRSGKQ
ncbi:MAG: dTDP-4-dehydrorhamnose reductase [Burkholderiales bacterium]|nr:dTDP-4-dehydrorhamnose reductase [Burkholderiales bacterium]